MSVFRHRFARLAFAVAAVPVLGLGLAACGGEETPPAETTATATSTESDTAPSSSTLTSTETGTTPESTTRSTTSGQENTTTQRTSEGSLDESVTEVAESFASLAPASLFAQFDACSPSGLEDSWQCSGSKVGQFQFFTGSAKAASTTQLLTELRSSRVVEDTGVRVVGWSTLGTTAVITVVDNDRGLVMQQMISSDREDPEDLIYELGLADRPAESTTSSPAGSATTAGTIEEA
ncbi:hypothetical protein COCCU_03555 [Corynebacterium occultum]|uniref:Beta-N-acetylhexosaminidase n=1 Tax=Corynebacterium occultum TaxID=2675219 RepID=A0A6B8W5S3_9CORY|nr:hypothetical protein [Corynebacterium occultum]QGU06665.1 hypothetical protein COCCU_03555 [Corynebacterium occultum]